MYIDSLTFCGVSFVYFVMQQQPLMGRLLILEVSRSHSDTRHSVGLFWTSNGPSQRPLLSSTQHSQERDMQATSGNRTRNSNKRAAVDPRLRRRGHRDQFSCTVCGSVQHNTGKLFKRYVLLTVHLGIILVNNQLDAQFFFLYVYFNSLHVSSSTVLIIRKRINFINMTSGKCYSESK